MRLDDLIQRHYEHMNASDRRIWQYICRHREECRKMSLHQLAEACEVSSTTILRFLKLIGMDGYHDFKAFLKWDSLHQPTVDQQIIEQNCYNLARTITFIQQADCSELFLYMNQAGRLYAYGSGAVQKATARIFKDYLILAKRLLHLIEGAEERTMAMQQMKEGDMMFLFSLSGNNQAMNDYAKALREKGVILTAVCQDGANELAKLCHFRLPFFTQKIDIGRPGPEFYSSAGMVPAIEILVLKYIAFQTVQNDMLTANETI